MGPLQQSAVHSELVTRARQALAASPIQQLRLLSVAEDAGVLLISGSVGSFYLKQVAQELLKAVAHPVPVENRLFVHYDDVRLADDE